MGHGNEAFLRGMIRTAHPDSPSSAASHPTATISWPQSLVASDVVQWLRSTARCLLSRQDCRNVQSLRKETAGFHGLLRRAPAVETMKFAVRTPLGSISPEGHHVTPKTRNQDLRNRTRLMRCSASLVRTRVARPRVGAMFSRRLTRLTLSQISFAPARATSSGISAKRRK